MDTLAMIGAMIGKVQRNHALEHATIAVLLARHGLGLQLAGHAAPGGFYISGNVTAAQVGSAAEEALLRLQGGERHLALSPLCGTNIVLGGGLAGLASLAVLGSGERAQRWPDVLAAAIVAVLAAQLFGRYAQRFVTTSADLHGLHITGTGERRFGRWRRIKVETHSE
ncbi:MAG: DUF6391 domain-containing protein [Chloroflexi bacterium]|nr:DUF6391 domain-containing protein [Chloroflexota bacterium]